MQIGHSNFLTLLLDYTVLVTSGDQTQTISVEGNTFSAVLDKPTGTYTVTVLAVGFGPPSTTSQGKYGQQRKNQGVVLKVLLYFTKGRYTVTPPIKDTPKEDKPPNKGQAEITLVYTLHRKSPLKEDNLSTKDKTAGPKSVLIKRFHCMLTCMFYTCSDDY